MDQKPNFLCHHALDMLCSGKGMGGQYTDCNAAEDMGCVPYSQDMLLYWPYVKLSLIDLCYSITIRYVCFTDAELPDGDLFACFSLLVCG